MPDPNRPLSDGKVAALKLLKQALDDAEDVGRDKWQFAIRKAALLAVGASVSDLRWLLVSHLAEAAHEITAQGDSKRKFSETGPLALLDGDCFVLTHGGKVYIESDLRLANGASQRDESPIAPRRAPRLGYHRAPTPHRARDANASALPAGAPRPTWRALDGELSFRGEIIRRRARKVATLEEFLLSVFDAADWPRAVLIALPNKSIETFDQLKECVRRLNDHMLRDTLRFHAHAYAGGAIASWEDRALNERGSFIDSITQRFRLF